VNARALSPWHLITRMGILVGIAMLVAAFVVKDVSTQTFAEKSVVSMWLAIAGGVIALACLIANYRAFLRLFTLRKTAAGVNMALLVVFCLSLTALICYISTRRFARIDMTGSRRHSLHSKTVRILRNLDKDLEVTLLYSLGEPTVSIWMDMAEDMLAEFRALNPRITIQQFDPYAEPEKTQDLLRELAERDLPSRCIVFKTPAGHEVIPFEKIVKTPPMYQGRPMGEPRFVGEAAFASALAKLMEEEKSAVYVLTGHGERPLEGQQSGPGAERTEKILTSEEYSLSRFVNKLRRDNIEVEPLNLAETVEVPEECAALIIPGPRTPFSAEELSAIEAYLQRNGRLLVMVDSAFAAPGEMDIGGLCSMLESYGVRVHAEAVGVRAIKGRDLFTGQTVSVTQLSVPVASDGYAEHAVTADLGNYTVQFRAAAPLEIQNAQQRPEFTAKELLTAISSSWGETSRGAELEDQSYDQGADIAGPVILGAVVEPGGPPGPYGLPMETSSDAQGPRIIILGSSFSFINGIVEQWPQNLYLALNAVNWLVGKKHLLGIPPKDLGIHQVTLTGGQARAAKWLFIGIVPAIFVVLGIAVWQIRRR